MSKPLPAPTLPGEVTFMVEATPYWPGANGCAWHMGTLDARQVATVLREIADRCESEWTAEKVERQETLPTAADPSHKSGETA